MFLVAQFDKYINCNYTMSVANQNKKFYQKVGGRGMKLLKKLNDNHMSNKEYKQYLLLILITIAIEWTLLEYII